LYEIITCILSVIVLYYYCMDKDVKENLGNRIRFIRKKQGLTLDEVAERCGIFKSNLSKVEKGQRNPTTDTLEKIASSLGCSIRDFFEPEYVKDPELPAGLLDLINDKKTMKLMNISEEEVEWMRSIRFRTNRSPTKETYIDMLYIYRNLNE